MKNAVLGRAIGGTVLSVPRAYASILFSENAWLGLLLLCLSMISPMIGLAGLWGVVVAILFSRLIGYENWDNATGILSFNSLLIAWAVAYYYPLSRFIHQPVEMFILVAVAGIMGQLLYIILSHWTQSAFRMPSMSLSFSIVALIVWYYFAKTGMLVADQSGKPLLFEMQVMLSPFWQQYFISLGSIFFSPYVLSGMVAAFVLLLISRLGFGLSILGWALCYYLAQIWSTTSGNGMYYPGFNVILTVVAIGGIFLLPGKSAWIIALLAGVLTYLLSVAGSSVFHYYERLHQTYTAHHVPVFALPFNVVVLIMVYAMRFRLKAVNPVVNDTGILHPEDGLEHYLSRLKRFTRLGIPQFTLPLTGEWIVTQGHQGKHTHKLDWAYAWDFELEDTRGQSYADRADQLTEYYGYGKPVLASAAGYVSKIVSHVVDNQPGGVNTQENWGNYVSISHGYGLWTLYAHLKKDSIPVKVGDYVNCGDKIGLVGNSGRSPLPHLHFQVQLGAEAGSRSKLSHLINYKVLRVNDEYEFIGSGIPREGERISAFIPSHDPAMLMGFQIDKRQLFLVTKGKTTKSEIWEMDLDFWGRMKLRSNNGTTLEYSVYYGIYNALGLSGKKLNALSAFALTLPRLPYSGRINLTWKDTPSISVTFGALLKNTMLFIIPLYNPLRVITQSRLISPSRQASFMQRVQIQSRTDFRLFGLLIRSYRGEIELDTDTGIQIIKLFAGDRLLVEAKRVIDQEEEKL